MADPQHVCALVDESVAPLKHDGLIVVRAKWPTGPCSTGATAIVITLTFLGTRTLAPSTSSAVTISLIDSRDPSTSQVAMDQAAYQIASEMSIYFCDQYGRVIERSGWAEGPTGSAILGDSGKQIEDSCAGKTYPQINDLMSDLETMIKGFSFDYIAKEGAPFLDLLFEMVGSTSDRLLAAPIAFIRSFDETVIRPLLQSLSIKARACIRASLADINELKQCQLFTAASARIQQAFYDNNPYG